MNRKKRITFFKLVHKTKHKSKNKSYFSFASFNKLFLNWHRDAAQNNTNQNPVFDATPFQGPRIDLKYCGYTPVRDEILYDKDFKYRGVDMSFKLSEVKIPRIRFKPGYQRM
jgi:hypothetical protein